MDLRMDTEAADEERSPNTGASGIGRRLAVVLAAATFALAGGAAVGCGDDDNEGPAEEAGQALDDAGSEAGEAVEEADQEVGNDKD